MIFDLRHAFRIATAIAFLTPILQLSAVSVTSAGNADVAATILPERKPVLSVQLPVTLLEGAAATGTVRISAAIRTKVRVTLTVNNSELAVPESVIIPAGATSVTFSIAGTDNALFDGSRSATVTAGSDGFVDARSSLTIRDNDPVEYRFGAFADIVNVNSPFTTTISPIDVEGSVINGFSGTVHLSFLLEDGSSQGVTPETVTLAGATGWTGSLTLSTSSTLPGRINAIDSNGIAGASALFEIMRTLPIKVADIAWDSSRNRIYASVPQASTDTYANELIAIDPATLQVTARVPTGGDPGQLAMTSGGEALYVALNGTRSIARIDLNSMNVVTTFAVGNFSPTEALAAGDISTVTGQPNLLIVSQRRNGVIPSFYGVAAYENGVMRPQRALGPSESTRIETSADPNLFFGFDDETSDQTLCQLRLDANGVSEIAAKKNILADYNTDIQSDGNRVVGADGSQADGANLVGLGKYPGIDPRAARPELSSNRIYFIEATNKNWSTSNKITSVDPSTLAVIRRLTFSPDVTLPSTFNSLVRPRLLHCGRDSFVFGTSNSIAFISTSRMAPTESSTNLHVTMQAEPNLPLVGHPLIYTVQISNEGANPARNTQATVAMSDFQSIQSAVSNRGTPVIAGRRITLAIDSLAPGESAALTITAIPDSAGPLSCVSGANSDAVDPNPGDNAASVSLTAGFQQAPNSLFQVRLSGRFLVYDPSRNLLWTTIYTGDSSLVQSVVSVDPNTGAVCEPILINEPQATALSISPNGRYLYVGRYAVPEVLRIDLTAVPPFVAHIPLSNNGTDFLNSAVAVQALEGDGTSFLVGTYNGVARVFDGTVERSTHTATNTVTYLTSTTQPNLFTAYYSSVGGGKFSKLLVTASGVSVIQSNTTIASTGLHYASGSGNIFLGSSYPSSGLLVDTNSLTLRSSLPLYGIPGVDYENGRVFVVEGNRLYAFNSANGAATGIFPLPVTSTGAWAQTCVRWGWDGFAILGYDGPYGTPGKLYIGRLSLKRQ
jgi:YVTN family beta-propeller protein